MRAVMTGQESTDALARAQADVLDIEDHMLHFLENHDEQRIASDDFAGNADSGRPAMVVSALIGSSPTMLYFGQEVGEPGDGNAGFGDPTRTSIFDYWGVPTHQRWMNDGAFDGGQFSEAEKDLRDFYKRLLRFSGGSSAIAGDYAEIHSYNRAQSTSTYDDRVFSFVRWSDDEQLIVLSNFGNEAQTIDVGVPENIIDQWSLDDGRFRLNEQLYGLNNGELIVENGRGQFSVTLGPLESLVYRLGDILQ
jgi:glycosidase